MRGALHRKQGRYSEAAIDYVKWADHIGDDSLTQWGYFNAAYCYNEAKDLNKAKFYISKVTDTEYMDFSFYKLRSIIYMKLAKLGDNSITQNMVCSDLMKVKNILERESDFEGYKKAQQVFDEVCK